MSSSGSLGMQRSGSNTSKSVLAMLKAETGLLIEGLDLLWDQDVHWGAREMPFFQEACCFLPEDGLPLNWLLHLSVGPSLVRPR